MDYNKLKASMLHLDEGLAFKLSQLFSFVVSYSIF